MYLVLLLFASALPAQTPSAGESGKRDFPLVSIPLVSIPILSINVEGNRILGAPAILSAAGLQPGQNGNADVFDAARDRLIASGYFETVSYRYKPARTGSVNPGYEVIYTVHEEDKLFPIRVDALGATTDEIAGFVKTRDPLFTGKMPGTKQVLDRTCREIEEFLGSRNNAQKVMARVVATAPGQLEIDFAPLRGLPAVSTVAFEGTRIVAADELRNKIAEVAFGQPFTEDGFRLFLENQIRPLYEAKGYMHVTFPKITAAPAPGVQGVDVQVTVDEGEQYKVSKVAVGGDVAGDHESLLKIARVSQTGVANADEVKDGAARVRESMRHQGYLDAAVVTDSKRDDPNRTVEFIISVAPGPLYRFGKLTVLGLGLDGEAAVRRIWSVKTGDPFPAEYPGIFAKRVKEESLFDNLADTKAEPDTNRTTHIVNVTLDFKYGPDNPQKRNTQPRLGPARQP